jgi:hypothetical protein
LIVILFLLKKTEMKKFKLIFLLFGMIFMFSCETLTDSLNTDLTDGEIAQGLREALRVGADTSTTKAHKLNGYYNNLKIKIPFPPEAEKAETVLRSIGLNGMVDTFVLKINRAAEDAADDAKDIFVNAIFSMSITDALSILKGADNAASMFLKTKTFDTLKSIFKPKINTSLSAVGATQAWSSVTSTYNAIPLVTPINTDLPEYASIKALDGLFVLIAEEELKIRKDPLARVTDILRKVFGTLDH